RQVHLAGLVFENSKLGNPARERFRIFGGVLFLDSEKNQNTGTDTRVFLAIDGNAGAGYSLDDGSHLFCAVEGAEKQLLNLPIHLSNVARIDVPDSLEL